MFKLTPLCLAAILLLQMPAASVHAQPSVSAAQQPLAARIDATIAPYFQAGEPGAIVLVTKDGKPVLRKAYGMADVGGKVVMTPDTSTRLGSITKQFTAVAVLMLAEQGKLALADPITKFLPDYPMQGKVITIEHLLTHTSGIVSYTGKPGFGDQVGRDVTVTQMIDSFKNDPLQFDPGSRFAYNNSGYFLLGAIIEKVSGQPYAKFLEQRIFVPLDMTQTAYEGMERAPAKRAVGHTRSEKGVVPSKTISMTQPYAAGALVSTVDDLARWDAALAAGKLLKPATLERAWTSYKLADGKPTQYGYGWGIGTVRGAESISHGGGINGFSTYALRLPKQNVYVAVLTNTDSGKVATEMVARKAAATAMGNPYPARTPMVLKPEALDAFGGTYKFNDKLRFVIERDKGNLVLRRTGSDPLTLTPFSANEFFIDDALVTFRFDRNAGGVVDKLVIVDEKNETVNERVADAAPASAPAPAPASASASAAAAAPAPAR